MNKNNPNITIELSLEEISILQKCVSLPIIKMLWKEEEKVLCASLNEFFKELINE